MEIQFENYGFYKIEKDYLRYLNSKDSQVFLEDTKEYERKPLRFLFLLETKRNLTNILIC